MILIPADLALEKIETLRAEEANRVVLGTADDWADYKHRAGIIEGLTRAARIINELIEDKR